ncbi:LONRF1, partial [Symbiodinium necroappetens]
VANGETVLVHSYVLMSASEVFTRMLQSEVFLEAQTGRIVLKDKTREEIQEVLKHLDLRNGAEPPPVTDQNVELLVRFADEYQVTGLRERCISAMKVLAKQKMIRYLKLAIKYNMPDIVELCVQHLVELQCDEGERQRQRNPLFGFMSSHTHAPTRADRAGAALREKAKDTLLGLEDNPAVRSAVYREVYKMIVEDQAENVRSVREEETSVPCSRHWKTLVTMLLAMRIECPKGKVVQDEMPHGWMAAFWPLLSMAVADFETIRDAEYKDVLTKPENFVQVDQEGEEEEENAEDEEVNPS